MNQNINSGSAGRTPVSTVLGGYLALGLPFLVAGGLDGLRVLVLGLHLAALAFVWLVSTPPGGAARMARDWFPLLLIPLLYLELPLLMEGMPGPVVYHDPTIAALELSLFGAQPSFEWAGAWPWAPVSELLHASYFSYYAITYVPGMLLHSRQDAFDETMLAVVLAFLLCYVVFIVFPVQGPRYLGVPAGVPDGPVRGLVLAVLEGGSSRGAAFPSAHVSVAVVQTAMALRHQPRVGWVLLPVALGLAAGAVYGGFHYGIDALAGALVGLIAAAAARPLGARLKAHRAG